MKALNTWRPRAQRAALAALLMRPRAQRAALAALPMLLLAAPHAFAVTIGAAGGAMPYSAGIGALSTSVQTEIAGFLILVCVVCGVAGYIVAGQFEGLMSVIGRAMVGVGIIGGVTAFAALAGVTGAVI